MSYRPYVFDILIPVCKFQYLSIIETRFNLKLDFFYRTVSRTGNIHLPIISRLIIFAIGFKKGIRGDYTTLAYFKPGRLGRVGSSDRACSSRRGGPGPLRERGMWIGGLPGRRAGVENMKCGGRNFFFLKRQKKEKKKKR